jgi:hypothetical protein
VLLPLLLLLVYLQLPASYSTLYASKVCAQQQIQANDTAGA